MPENIKILLDSASQALPFMAAASQGGPPKLNTARILEQLLLTAVLAAGGALWLIPTIEAKLSQIEEEVKEVGQDLKEVKDDVVQLKIDAAVDRSRHSKEPHP